MQLLVQVYCRGQGSPRNKIAGDRRLGKYGLWVEKEQTPGRKPGWMKVQSSIKGRRGAINVEWDAHAKLLTCRIVTRLGKPAGIVGDLIEYLLAHQRSRIKTIVLLPSV